MIINHLKSNLFKINCFLSFFLKLLRRQLNRRDLIKMINELVDEKNAKETIKMSNFITFDFDN